jgi:hypothetical protein
MTSWLACVAGWRVPSLLRGPSPWFDFVDQICDIFDLSLMSKVPAMNISRLTAVGSSILRSAELAPRANTLFPLRSHAKATAFFHTSRRRQQTAKPTRYGTAKEPPAHLQTKIGSEAEGSQPVVTEAPAEDAEAEASSTPAEEQAAPIELPPPPEEPVQTIVQPKPEIQEDGSPKEEIKSPLDRVMDMESPNQPDDEKAPHLQAPRYVHHFDTFSLVRDLQRGGFTENQTIDIMKAIRGLLGENMNLARRALVSKSNVENVCYTPYMLVC